MADFNIAYEQYIKPFEGGYVNDSADKGGETYGGIARNFHANWLGWSVIDQIKRDNGGKIVRYARFPQLNESVKSFFKNMWDKINMSEVDSQNVANIIFDFYVNSENSAAKAIQRIVGVEADGVIGPKTITAINRQKPESLFSSILAYREDFYRNIVKRDPSQARFLNGWLNRLKPFAKLAVKTSASLAGVGILIALFLLIKN